MSFIAMVKRRSVLGNLQKSDALSWDQPTRDSTGQKSPVSPSDVGSPGHSATMRVLRLNEVMKITGLRKTTIYQLQSIGEFPRRVKMTAQAVGWIEEEVRSWIKTRMAARTDSRVGQAASIRPDKQLITTSSDAKKCP
jgi:prophage regulatory protein